MQSTDARLAAALEDLARVVRRMATTGGLTLPAAATLARLAREGPQRLTDLAADEGVSQPGMTQLVTRLERDGLARRTACAEDGRVVLVEVTDHGRDLVERRRAERVATLHDLLAQLPDEERDAVRRAVPGLAHLAALALPTRTAPAPSGGSA
jgi:DNA-binding MarR family transcriptional regulator